MALPGFDPVCKRSEYLVPFKIKPYVRGTRMFQVRIAPPGFEPGSREPESRILDRCTTGLEYYNRKLK